MSVIASKKTWVIVAAVVALLVVWSILKTMSGFMGRKMVESLIEHSVTEEADVDMNSDGTINIETKEGSFSTGNAIPKEWPTDVPAYDGAEVTYSASASPAEGKSGMALILATNDAAEDVRSFYDAKLKLEGWTLTNTLQGGGSIVITAEKDGRQLSVIMNEADGKTGITLGVEGAQ